MLYSPRYLPRKGTETWNLASYLRNFQTFATIFTPQGDGNLALVRCPWVHNSIRHDIYPARGRKLERHIAKRLGIPWFATIFTPQGDGNKPVYQSPQQIETNQFATIFTPQGDGNYILGFFYGFTNLSRIRHDIYPARGRKLWKQYTLPLRPLIGFATIFTPQGDGNHSVQLESVLGYLLFATIFTPQGDGNPDRYLAAMNVLRLLFATIFTPQGDGNRRRCDRYFLSRWSNSPRYLPRKGTETGADPS